MQEESPETSMKGAGLKIFTALILVLALLIGCVGIGEDAKFKSHVKKATEYVKKGSNLELEAIKKGSEDDYEQELELLSQAIQSYKNAKREMDLAYSSTNDEQKKKWVECMNVVLDYFIKRAEIISEGAKLGMVGRDDEAMELLDDIYKYSDLAKQQRLKCQKFEKAEWVRQ